MSQQTGQNKDYWRDENVMSLPWCWLQLCFVCNCNGKQTEMQPCVVCLDVSNPSKAPWCHEDCLSVAARHRMDKGRPAEWRCLACTSQARLALLLHSPCLTVLCHQANATPVLQSTAGSVWSCQTHAGKLLIRVVFFLFRACCQCYRHVQQLQ